MVGSDWCFVRGRLQYVPKGSRKPVKTNPKAEKIGIVFRSDSCGAAATVWVRIVGLVRKDCCFNHFQIKRIDCSRFRQGNVSISLNNGDIVFLCDAVPISLRELVHSLGSAGVAGAFRKPPTSTSKLSNVDPPARNMVDCLDDDCLQLIIGFCAQPTFLKLVCLRFSTMIAAQRTSLDFSKLTKSKVVLISSDIKNIVVKHRNLCTLNFGNYHHVSGVHLREIQEQGSFDRLKVLQLCASINSWK